jgi:hypothetical protein
VTRRYAANGEEVKRIVLAVAGAAAAGLTACSHPVTPTAAHARHSAVSVPVSCSQQYHAWQHGQGKGLTAALRTVSLAETTGGTQVLTTALKKARRAIAVATSHPMPACADPRGYWDVLLMHVSAALASRDSASSVRAAMKDVPEIEQELIAELEHMSR